MPANYGRGVEFLISRNIKKKIYNECHERKKKTIRHKIDDFLKNRNLITHNSTPEIIIKKKEK